MNKEEQAEYSKLLRGLKFYLEQINWKPEDGYYIWPVEQVKKSESMILKCGNCGCKAKHTDCLWMEVQGGKKIVVTNEHGVLKTCPKCNSTWLIKANDL